MYRPLQRLAPRRRVAASLYVRWLCLILACLLLPACFGEQSFPMHPERLARLDAAQVSAGGGRLTTRDWTVLAHAVALRLLPDNQRHALTTDQLSHGGQIVNVWQHFRVNPDHVDSLLFNLDGVAQSAAGTSPPSKRDPAGHLLRPNWPGFQQVDVPVSDGGVLYGLLGVPDRAAALTPPSCVILTHGLFGSLDGEDGRNCAAALRSSGHYVLAIEMRGHGETNIRHPEYIISFGIRECGDLLAAAHWLKEVHGFARVGLLTYSLTGYEALLAAWLDGAAPVDDFRTIPILAELPRPGAEPAFNAGMLIVSAPVDVVATADAFDTRHARLDAPVKATFENHVADRINGYHQEPTSSMWGLADREFARGGWESQFGPFPQLKTELLRLVDLHAGNWQQGAQRLENIRHPVLLLSAANDPLATAQGVAELFGRVHNPNVGVIMLQGGGHMGFAALSADYFYSLVVNFFDPRTAPASHAPAPLARLN